MVVEEISGESSSFSKSGSKSNSSDSEEKKVIEVVKDRLNQMNEPELRIQPKKAQKSVFTQVDAPARDEYLVDISEAISDDIHKSLDEYCGLSEHYQTEDSQIEYNMMLDYAHTQCRKSPVIVQALM